MKDRRDERETPAAGARPQISPVALPVALGLVLLVYVASGGPAMYAVGRGWISWDRYRAIFSPIDEVLWGTDAHRQVARHREWWKALGKRHQPPPLSGLGRSVGRRWVSLKYRQPPRFIPPGAAEHARLGARAGEDLVLIDDRVVGIGETEIRIDGRVVLTCLPTEFLQVQCDDGTLDAILPSRRRYME